MTNSLQLPRWINDDQGKTYSQAKNEYESLTGLELRKATDTDRVFNPRINYVSPPGPTGGAWGYFENVADILNYCLGYRIMARIQTEGY